MNPSPEMIEAAAKALDYALNGDYEHENKAYYVGLAKVALTAALAAERPANQLVISFDDDEEDTVLPFNPNGMLRWRNADEKKIIGICVWRYAAGDTE